MTVWKVKSKILYFKFTNYCFYASFNQKCIIEEASKLRTSATDVDETIGVVEDFLKKLHFLAVEVRNMLEHNTVNSFHSQLYKKQLSIDCGKQFRVVLPFPCFGCFLFDWTTKLAPPSRLIRCKTKTKGDLVPRCKFGFGFPG